MSDPAKRPTSWPISGRNLKTFVEVEVHPSAYELAEAFWAMDAEEQAGFFHRLGEVSDGGLPFQLQHVMEGSFLTDEARRVMAMIGEYATPND